MTALVASSPRCSAACYGPAGAGVARPTIITTRIVYDADTVCDDNSCDDAEAFCSDDGQDDAGYSSGDTSGGSSGSDGRGD